MPNYDPELQTHFRLWLDGEEVPFPEGSARFVNGTIDPIDEAVSSRRTVNGTLRVQADPAFRKFRLTVSCTDAMLPALFGIDPRQVATVWSPVVVRERGNTPSRTPVPGSLVAEDNWIEYRPVLTGYLTSIPSLSEPEWQSDANWSLVFEESTVPTVYFVTLDDAELATVSPGGSLTFNVGVLTTTNTGLPVTFARVGGSLPPGTTLNASTGVISGTPTTAGLYTFTIRATSGGQTGEQTYSILVNAASAPRVNFAAVAQQDYTPGTYLGLNLAPSVSVQNSTGVPVFSVVSGSLPPGLTLTTSGVVFGTPTGYGPFAAQIRAIIPSGEFDVQTIAFNAVAPSVVFAPVAAQTHVPGTAFSLDLAPSVSVSNSAAVPTFSIVSGSLPAGLSLSSGGVISGTPTAFGAFSVVVRATITGGFSDDQRVAFNAVAPTVVFAPVPLQAIPPSPVSTSFSLAPYVSVSGSSAVPTFSVVSGSLPTGAALSSSGIIMGTMSSGTFSAVVRASISTAAGTVSADQTVSFQIEDTPPLATGGTVIDFNDPDTGLAMRALRFTASDNLVVTRQGWADVEYHGSGGGGGFGAYGAGGGAGARIRRRVFLVPGTYPQVVPAGGVGGPSATVDGGDGSPATGLGFSAQGGGGGASRRASGSSAGRAGASGGGAALGTAAGGAATAPASMSEGNVGGSSTGASQAGAGGGGAGGPGTAPNKNDGGTLLGGDGGAGAVTNFDGTNRTVGAGGGGGGRTTTGPGLGGSGVGGNGGTVNTANNAIVAPTPGAANTGSGGGGAGGAAAGAAGGSGYITIRFRRL